jgi:hypothetical protein
MMKRDNNKQRFFNLIYHWNKYLLNNLSYIFYIFFIIFIIYFFNLGLYFFKLFISVVIFHFIFNKFKYSDNFVIKLLQKFILYCLCLYFSIYVMIFFDLFNTISCDSDDEDDNEDLNNDRNDKDNNDDDNNNVNNKGNNNDENKSTSTNRSSLEIIADTVVKVYKEMSDTSAAISAGGVAASAFIKSVPNAGLSTKVAGASAIGMGVSASTLVGSKVVGAISDNLDYKESIKDLEESIKDHPYSDPSHDRVPSPDRQIMDSPLESGDGSIPLIDLLESLVSLNMIELYLIISLILILFNQNIIDLYIKIVSKILNKYISIKYQNKIMNILNISKENNKKYNNILLIIIISILILIKLVNLFVSYHLYDKIDDYILVYNHLKNIDKNSILLLVFNNKLSIKNSFKLNNKYTNYSSKTVVNKNTDAKLKY